MPIYWFNLSPTTADLALLELKEVLKQHRLRYKGLVRRDDMAVMSLPRIEPDLLNRLGGVVWAAEEVKSLSIQDDPLPVISQLMKAKLASRQYKRMAVFGYIKGRHNSQLSQRLTISVKEIVGLSYLNLNRIRINQKRLSDSLIYILVQHKQTQYILNLIWYYPWEAYYRRDKSRPFIQPTAGMLPPKIARMMVNISLNQPPPAPGYLLDPFAGSGTILIEALSLNQAVIGIEKHPRAYQGLKTNIEAFRQESSQTPEALIYHGRAESVTNLIGRVHISGVATEPYLGPAFRIKTNRFGKSYYTTAAVPHKPLTLEKLESIINNLHKLYSKWLRNQARRLKEGTKVVLILPLFHFHNRFYRINLFDKKGVLDYTLYQGPFTIKSQRDLAVRRQVFVLKKV